MEIRFFRVLTEEEYLSFFSVSPIPTNFQLSGFSSTKYTISNALSFLRGTLNILMIFETESILMFGKKWSRLDGQMPQYLKGNIATAVIGLRE